MFKSIVIIIMSVLHFLYIKGVQGQVHGHGPFSHADTLRGSITPERIWWDVQRYDLTIKPNYQDKYTDGSNLISYKVSAKQTTRKMQIDLQPPLSIDSAILDSVQKVTIQHNTTDANVWYIYMPQQAISSSHTVRIFFSGNPHIAIRPPWDGGWTFAQDSLGRPWMTVCCQGLGASVWYPCKDHQSDEPDHGASLTMIIPDTLTGVANGHLLEERDNHDGTKTFKWGVSSPISTYCLIPYIGKYVNIKNSYLGENGSLDLSFWALDYHTKKAQPYFNDQAEQMLTAYEYWFGPYPFYKDTYKLVETDNTGMEHQSNIGYGNHYAYGYRGRDDSHTGYGLKCDFIIIHESGHEWWGNSLTSYDLADMWVHESFTNYAEALFTEYHWGKKAGNDYVFGVRGGIHNKETIIPAFNVNAEGSGDMYPKGGNMLHSIRHSMDNDMLFRNILRGLQKDYYHQIVTGKQVVAYFNKKSGYDYSKVFDQYLNTIQIPVLKIYFTTNEVHYKYDSCIASFNLPIVMREGENVVKLYPSQEWKTQKINWAQKQLLTAEQINYMYYIHVKETEE
ncbi:MULTISPECIES: M1 family metallopeptidase [Chitinophagaceae]